MNIVLAKEVCCKSNHGLDGRTTSIYTSRRYIARPSGPPLPELKLGEGVSTSVSTKELSSRGSPRVVW